jgi:hypothetical protein
MIHNKRSRSFLYLLALFIPSSYSLLRPLLMLPIKCLASWYFKWCLTETRTRPTILDRDSIETEPRVIFVDRISIDFNPSATFVLPVSKKALTAKDGPQTWRAGGATRSRNSKQHEGYDMRSLVACSVVWFPHPSVWDSLHVNKIFQVPHKKIIWHKVSRVYGSVTNNNGFWIGFINTFFIQLVLTSNTALSLIYTIYSSPLHTH